eukprot:737357-Rhodomonas_salina.1
MPPFPPRLPARGLNRTASSALATPHVIDHSESSDTDTETSRQSHYLPHPLHRLTLTVSDS